MYSSHTIDSVTCLRLSSRCTAAQSGSACRRWPRRVPGPAPALANSRASSTVSVTSSGNGQVSPAASNRRIVNRTVEGAVPTRRAISRVGIPADFNLITSRTWRIANLSVGIQVPLRKAERRDRIGARRGPRHPGRHHTGMVGEIIPEWWATSSGISIGGTAYAKPGVYMPTKPPFAVADRKQPYFKLHGSSNWRTGDGSSLLIMGGNKSANIAASELLSWYEQEFRNALREPGARLMVIGYGFADTHINDDIREGASAGMKLFVIDPNGVDAIDTLRSRNMYNFGSSLRESFIGASRRDLRTTLTTDRVERAKVMHFFS